MKKIIFVCHGNICRSPAAEYIAKKYIATHNLKEQFLIFSRAVSYEEIGNDIYPYMKKELIKNDIDFSLHKATLITSKEIETSDYIFYMDDNNFNYLQKYINKTNENKILPITKFTPSITYIEDPWYTGNFKKVIEEISLCIKDIFNNI